MNPKLNSSSVYENILAILVIQFEVYYLFSISGSCLKGMLLPRLS